MVRLFLIYTRLHNGVGASKLPPVVAVARLPASISARAARQSQKPSPQGHRRTTADYLPVNDHTTFIDSRPRQMSATKEEENHHFLHNLAATAATPVELRVRLGELR